MKDNTKTHTTNYFDTFIEVAEDTKVLNGTKPTSRYDSKTIAEMQYDIISKNPYKYTSDEILFKIYVDRNDLTKTEYKQAKEQFFSKGQACFRASPLTKTYGFGVHCDSEGKIALYGVETKEYQKILADTATKKIKAMRSTKK